MKSLVVNLVISAEEMQRLYAGTAQVVFAQSSDGRRIRFPASILRPFILHNGVSGSFQIDFDDENRFQSIRRLS